MDTDILLEFAELAKRLNFTETARVLNMSQPTLSKHISSFERELRIELFDRSERSLRLTRAGMELLPYAYKIIEGQNEFNEKVKFIRTTPPAQLRVGGLVEEELVAESIGRILVAMSEHYGRNFLEVLPTRQKYPVEMLEDNEIDIIFDYSPSLEEESDIGAAEIGRIPWIVLVSKTHRLAGLDGVSIEDLRDETFVKIEGTHVSEAWSFIEECCSRHGFAPNVKRHYSMRLPDLITTAASLNDEVLVLGRNFVKRMGIGTIPFCEQIPIGDDDAFFPVAALYSKKAGNPLVPETIDIIRNPSLHDSHA